MEDATDSVRHLAERIARTGPDVLTLLPRDRYDFSSATPSRLPRSAAPLPCCWQAEIKLIRAKVDRAFLQRLLVQATAIGPDDKLSAVNACLALSQLTKQTACSEPSLQLANKPQ